MGLQEVQSIDIDPILEKFQRLGIILEFWDFNGSKEEFSWLKKTFFQGVHLSIGLMRTISMTTNTQPIFNQLTNILKSQKIHTLQRGLSLVHDLTFARNLQTQLLLWFVI
jgi:EAL domain-containing protein (putative c-di-GMP-specific phosphodiesterase class I)